MKRKLFATLAIAFVVLAMLACGIGPVLVSLSSTLTPVVPTSVPTVAPTAAPQPNYDAEIEYLTAQGTWASDCGDAYGRFGEVINNTTSDSWDQDARVAIFVGDYYCSFLGGYETVPDMFVYVQSEIDKARADYGTAFDYAADGVNNLDANSFDYCQLYLDKGTAHVSNATVEMDRVTDEIR